MPTCRPWEPPLCHKVKAAQNEVRGPPPVSCGLTSEKAIRGQSDTYSLPLSDGENVVQWLCYIILNSSETKKVKSQWATDLNLRPKTIRLVQFSSIQSLSHVQLFVTPWTTACQASLFITSSQSPSKPMPIVSVMPSNHLILCCPLLLLP